MRKTLKCQMHFVMSRGFRYKFLFAIFTIEIYNNKQNDMTIWDLMRCGNV